MQTAANSPRYSPFNVAVGTVESRSGLVVDISK
jgi:hypothetical protein